ncbi:MAG TPA: hypothetical protein VMV84_04275 [Dehalococcoidales bacterium]|nr:hypothetical protein [Dehalococcoidales bacterium]
MPAKVKEVVQHNLLSEWHLQELLELSVAQHLSPWLTTSQAWEELAQKAVHDRAKNGSRPVKGYKSWRHFGDKLKRTGCHQKDFSFKTGLWQLTQKSQFVSNGAYRHTWPRIFSPLLYRLSYLGTANTSACSVIISQTSHLG